MFSLQIIKTGKVYFTAVEFFSLYVNKQNFKQSSYQKNKTSPKLFIFKIVHIF